MAHSARLHLRMQKEIKLLATDPPPGVSIPSLSNHSYSDSSFSFSTIDARIEGPEGTVYAKGVFNIKIQIPDRYPFQPPKVTFSTPIYHPNIDNGGRICLDILNLPPKGAWQPSLNISTVLTSIGLLLSEPNPDDGLVCEASREYKYNRQAFDQKARSWTERYAKPGAVDGSSSRGLVNIPNMVIRGNVQFDLFEGIYGKRPKMLCQLYRAVYKLFWVDPTFIIQRLSNYSRQLGLFLNKNTHQCPHRPYAGQVHILPLTIHSICTNCYTGRKLLALKSPDQTDCDDQHGHSKQG